MRHLILTIVTIAICLAAGGCARREAETTLDRAEALMHEDPAGAMSLLRDSIDAAALPSGSELQARYALLLSQALDKNRMELNSDSLISIAADYYAAHPGDGRGLMLANFYLGRVRYNCGLYPQAIIQYLKALEKAEADSDHYWIGLICREISKSYNPSSNCAEEVHYAQKAFDHMRRTGKHSYTCSTMIKLINALYDKSEYNKGLQYSYQLKDTVETYQVKKYERSVYCLIGKGYMLLNDYKKALPFLEKTANMPNATTLDSAYLGLALIATDDTTNAQEVYRCIETNNNPAIMQLKADIAIATGDYKRACRSLIILDSLSDIKYDSILGSDIPRLITEQQIEERNRAKSQLSDFRFTTKIIAGALILLIVPIGIRMFFFYRKQKKEIDKNITIANELREILSVSSNKDEKANKIIEETLASKYELIDHLCRELYQKQHSSTVRQRISSEISTILSCFGPNGSITAKLEAEANKYYNNIITDFHEEFPNLKIQDYTLFLFSVWGFSVASISMIQNEEKIEAVYNRRARLKTRIKRSDSPNAARYLQFLQ